MDSMYSNGLSSSSTMISVPMPVLQQTGEVFVGPGARKEASLVGLGLAKLSSRRKDDMASAKRYAMDISIKQIMLRQQKQQQENQQKQAMYAQALSLMSRVYVGSISFEIREDMLRKTFEAFGPIKSLNMGFDNVTGHHKGFAFLEYEVPEAALLAQETMNGQLMGGRNLKVGRPSNMPQAQPIIEMVMADARKFYRVYVASVHPDLSESDLKTVFEAFGEVVSCKLARSLGARSGAHRGFGYIEFNNGKSMMESIAGMNMFDLGGQYLRVGRCVTPPEALTYLTGSAQGAIPAAAAVAAAAVTAKVIAAEASSGKEKGKDGSGASTPRSSSPMPGKVKAESKLEPVSPGGSPNSKGSITDSPKVSTKLENMNLSNQAATPPPPLSQTETGTNGYGSPAIKEEPNDMDISNSPKSYDSPAPDAADRASFVSHPVMSVPVPPLREAAQPPPPPPPSTTGRRRGFGGFATDVPPVAVAPPGVIPPPGVVAPNNPPPGLVKVVQPPGIYVPPGTSAVATKIAPKPKPEKKEEVEGTIEDIEDDPEAAKYFQKLTSAEIKKLKRQRKRENQTSFQDRMGAILSAQHQQQKDVAMLPAEFGTADPLTAPRDPSDDNPLQAGSMMMITGGDRVDRDNASMALSLIDTQGALAMRDEMKKKAKMAALANPQEQKKYVKPGSQFRVPKKKQPKLKTANALKAVQAMGELKDQLMAEQSNSEDATLASQEKGLEIRGNDARHLLMAKLMRTNRSTVLVLRNMVMPEDIDEYLEEEVKEECGKFGEVEEVVIANDPANRQVKIFVRFAQAQEVDEAKKVMDGRFFAGRTVKADAYDLALFEHGDYTG
ncbi:hypothetical protein WR25_04166 isoform B [Diploscapter pachys]|uniref:RRM domain-containing protein n=1 Tax=Diploscapter pachys TaxID=2018661 RepID=A0A2A2J4W9_9BILA|nr:hypothetical protein WR25_04166 isoform B [Diploscapter pachys]